MQAHEFASLFDAHAARLVLYARQWCAAPEDVVQEALLRLARLRAPPDDVVAYLYRMVRNAALDAGKMQRRREHHESQAARVAWFAEPAVEGLDAEAAVRALEQVAPEQREVIVARLWGGLSFEQIAAVAGCSASTAFRRYEAGIEALRRLLGVSCPTTYSSS